MRTAFSETLFDLAKQNPHLTLLVGDLGFGVFNSFMQELPHQFINMGVAEQNMMGAAAGMALSGKTVFVYSIANFPIMRCLEQIRNDVCYHRANVKIVSVGSGVAYGALGSSHHATEDIAIMRSLPGMKVVAPGDPVETRLLVRQVMQEPGPVYLRIGRSGEPTVHLQDPPVKLGKAIKVRDGSDCILITTGAQLATVVQASEILSRRNIHAGVLSMHTIKPLDMEALRQAATSPAIFTVEEHSVIGGLGSAVAEMLLEQKHRPNHFQRIGFEDAFSSVAGDQDYLRAHNQLNSEGIAAQVERSLSRL